MGCYIWRARQIRLCVRKSADDVYDDGSVVWFELEIKRKLHIVDV